MHPGEHDGHVIDLGLDGSITTLQSLNQMPLMSIKNDSDDMMDDEPIIRMSIGNENNYQQVKHYERRKRQINSFLI